MDHKDNLSMPEDSFEVDVDESSSVDEFIRQLEAKEKDLHITSDVEIEVENVPENPLQESLEREVQGTRSPGPGNPGLKTRVYELENEVEELRSRIRDLRSERNEIQEKSDRRLKDFESYKYRVDRERRGAYIEQIATLASHMLPVLDNLDRALSSAAALEAPRSAEFQQFYDGIVLVNQQVNDVFEELGVMPIEGVGQPFDPNLHEAVAAEERADLPPNTIVEEMLRGYRIGNRIIRHSMVKVTTRPTPSRFDPPAADSSAENDG
jgi:molecular chaperone GrpE